MRIAGYNIMSGGFDGYETTSPVPQRLPEVKLAVQELGADVVGLVDTFRWDEIFTTDEICEHFGYRYAFCVNLGDDRLTELGHNNGLTLLSNVELEDVRSVRIATRNAISARVRGGLRLVLVYLDDLSEDVRVSQVKALAPEIDSSVPTVVVGDLNSFKASDLPDLSGVYESAPVLAGALAPIVADMQRGEVAELLESLGLQDASPAGRPTFPTQLFPIKLDEPVLRLDYCFHTASATVRDFSVPNSEIFQKASDHLPVVFDVV
ncbi:endonuclease/exonuclease/phosphatase family protein [Allokutzneria multivorans]|uniref:endonuclease/exonuclease/phosphatase family protein n=1 Tax=Allokutzneria multivorans TaxID=1142134 RepID=UPI0031ECAB67